MPTPQAPIDSGFGAASTAAEVIAGHDLTGKAVVESSAAANTTVRIAMPRRCGLPSKAFSLAQRDRRGGQRGR